MIRGWANYHRHVASKQTFNQVDYALYQAIWRWAKRRHPRKTARWVRQKYSGTHNGRQWTFYGEVEGPEGKTRRIHLLRAGKTAIQRHVKIKSEANPYDPEWEVYFEQRLGVKMAAHLAGRRTLNFLWREQGGCCPVCQQPITELTGWHNHHLVWRSMGGSDRSANRVLLHPACHRQVHSLGLIVVKPRPERGVC
jgi:RNA-directed DNA polymerase